MVTSASRNRSGAAGGASRRDPTVSSSAAVTGADRARKFGADLEVEGGLTCSQSREAGLARR